MIVSTCSLPATAKTVAGVRPAVFMEGAGEADGENHRQHHRDARRQHQCRRPQHQRAGRAAVQPTSGK